MRHATVLVAIDAGRHDYVDPDWMPFLHGLSREARTSRVDAPLGHDARNALYTGRYPDTSGSLGAYVFDPRTVARPAWPRPTGLLAPARRALTKITRRPTAHGPDPDRLPASSRPFLRRTDEDAPAYRPRAYGAPSLFDLCREQGLRFRFLDAPVSPNDEWTFNTLAKELRERQRFDLYVAHFHSIDRKSHALGPRSDALRRGPIRDLDEKLANIHAALAAGYESWDLLVLGTHGMTPVRRRVDVLGHLRRADARPGRDYVALVHGTYAQFWYRTPRGRRAVEALLPLVPGTRALEPGDQARLRIPRDGSTGDRILAADPGTLIAPNHSGLAATRMQAAHGYADRPDEDHGMGLLASSNGNVQPGDAGVRPLVDAFPTLCDLLGLSPPPSHEGHSLLAPRTVEVKAPVPILATVPTQVLADA